MTDEKRLNEFLGELDKLADKYGLYVWGCGCCNSPCILEVGDSNFEEVARDLKYDNQRKTYSAERL